MLISGATVATGLSFLQGGLAGLAVPGLVAAALFYGLGVGPVSFVLMSTLFTQKHKSAGCVAAQSTRSLFVFIQLKVPVQNIAA